MFLFWPWQLPLVHLSAFRGRYSGEHAHTNPGRERSPDGSAQASTFSHCRRGEFTMKHTRAHSHLVDYLFCGRKVELRQQIEPASDSEWKDISSQCWTILKTSNPLSNVGGEHSSFNVPLSHTFITAWQTEHFHQAHYQAWLVFLIHHVCISEWYPREYLLLLLGTVFKWSFKCLNCLQQI